MGGVKTCKAFYLVRKAAVLVASLQQLPPHRMESLMMLMQQLPVLLPDLQQHDIMSHLLTHSLMYSFGCLRVCYFIPSFNHSHLITHSCMPSRVCSCICSFVRSFVRSSIRSFIRTFPLTLPCMHSRIQSFTLSPFCSFVYAHLLNHPFTQSSNQSLAYAKIEIASRAMLLAACTDVNAESISNLHRCSKRCSLNLFSTFSVQGMGNGA